MPDNVGGLGIGRNWFIVPPIFVGSSVHLVRNRVAVSVGPLARGYRDPQPQNPLGAHGRLARWPLRAASERERVRLLVFGSSSEGRLRHIPWPYIFSVNSVGPQDKASGSASSGYYTPIAAPVVRPASTIFRQPRHFTRTWVPRSRVCCLVLRVASRGGVPLAAISPIRCSENLGQAGGTGEAIPTLSGQLPRGDGPFERAVRPHGLNLWFRHPLISLLWTGGSALPADSAAAVER